MNMMLYITTVACLLVESCQAFVLAPRQNCRPNSITRTFVSSIGGAYRPYNSNNQTAMDVLESLDFLANIKYSKGRNEECSGVPLFEATREVVIEDNDVSTNEATTLNANGAGIAKNKRAKEFEVTMDSELDDVLHQVSASSNKKKKGGKQEASENDNATNEPSSKPGIGGSGGTVYNVNKLKRNLVQEMVKSYKTEMWDDLGDPSVDLAIVEDKLASLVQSNAVKCTTDSNLLDGEWTFAFGSRQSAAALMDPNRFDIAARRNKKTQAVKSTFRTSSRTFYLEDMDEDENAHVLDKTRYMGGLLTKVSRYNVARLTRTSLMLEPCTQQTWFLGKCMGEKTAKTVEVENLRILYVDNDLCLTVGGDFETSPFYVWTKSKAWVGRTQSMKRGARRVFGALRRVRNSIFNVIFLRKRIRDAVISKVAASYDDSGDRILVDIDDESKRLTVLKLGDLENDANAWEGEEDPFVHLSADERQEKLKKMRVRDVRRAGRKQRKRNFRKGKKTETRKPFKKPE